MQAAAFDIATDPIELRHRSRTGHGEMLPVRPAISKLANP